MSVAFFDMDGTLWPVSVERSFAGYLRRTGVLKRSQLGLVIWNYLRYELGLVPDHDTFKKNAIRSLFSNIVADEIDMLYLVYFEKELKPLLFEKIRRRVEAHKKSGDAIVVISASLALAVKPLANHLGADAYFGTELEIDDTRYTGEVLGRIHYAEKKAATLREYAKAKNIDLQQCWAYGDRLEDRYMLDAVGHPVAVNPKSKLVKLAKSKNWEILHAAQV